MDEKFVVGSVGGGKSYGMRALTMAMMLGALVDPPYSPIETPVKREKRRQLNCRTCIVKKDDPSYCVRCRELNE